MLRRHDDPVEFRDLVTPWLVRDEARYNLLLALTEHLANGVRFGDEPPVLLSLWDGDDLAGVAFRTPPHNLILDAVPVAHAGEVADAVGVPPSAVGPPDVVAAFAERAGVPYRVTRRQGIYRLDTLVPPRPARGALRAATTADEALVLAWDRAFVIELGLPEHEAGRLHERIEDVLVWLWEDEGEVVSLAACGGFTPNGARIGPVYTPPEKRGRGYASAVTAGATRALLERGRSYCFLYTDLANPTSNGIYRAMGYQQVAEVVEAAFHR